MADTANRRPIKERGSAWARWLAARLAYGGANPDLISAASVAFSVFAAALLLGASLAELPLLRGALLVGAAVAIPLRLVCNLLDGMVAVEHGRGSSAGPIWNELPDRFSDVAVLAAAGYAASASVGLFAIGTGWFCAVLAVMTAYVRELGRGLGFAADFSGPFAKQQRMTALTAACVVSAIEPLWGWRGQCLMIGLVVIALGTVLTLARRTLTLARRLAERGASAR